MCILIPPVVCVSSVINVFCPSGGQGDCGGCEQQQWRRGRPLFHLAPTEECRVQWGGSQLGALLLRTRNPPPHQENKCPRRHRHHHQPRSGQVRSGHPIPKYSSITSKCDPSPPLPPK